MLKRLFRLTDNKDFQTVYRRGRYNATALFSVNVLANHLGVTKVGVVVNKKVTKKANERNTVKRQVREIVRLLHSELQKGQSVIITVKQPALTANYRAMEQDILISFRKLGLLTNEKTTEDN